MKGLFGVAIVVCAGIAVADAQQRKLLDLEMAPPDHQVESLWRCNGTHEVRLKDGSIRQFLGYDLSFEIDSRPNRPKSGMPDLAQAGRAGYRTLLMFSGLEEVQSLPHQTCERVSRPQWRDCLPLGAAREKLDRHLLEVPRSACQRPDSEVTQA